MATDLQILQFLRSNFLGYSRPDFLRLYTVVYCRLYYSFTLCLVALTLVQRSH